MTKVFIIGAHRTGTKTLAGFFDECFESTKGIHQYDTLRFVNVFSNMHISKKLPQSFFHLFLRKFWLNKIDRETIQYYVESNGFNYIAANYAKTYYPNVKIIHAIRDPRGFITSYYNWVGGKTSSSFAKKIIPYWNISGSELGHFSKEEWANMDTFQRFAYYWNFKNEMIEELYADDTDNYFILKFENLINQKKRPILLQNMLSYIGLHYNDNLLTYFDKKQNQSKQKILGKWQTWTPEQCKQVHDICHVLMKKYNYGNEPEWLEKLEHVR